jgi:hypothetical protein
VTGRLAGFAVLIFDFFSREDFFDIDFLRDFAGVCRFFGGFFFDFVFFFALIPPSLPPQVGIRTGSGETLLCHILKWQGPSDNRCPAISGLCARVHESENLSRS